MKTNSEHFENSFLCCQCGLYKELQKDGGTGYGIDPQGFKICYACIGANDERYLANAKPGEKFTFYLSGNEVTNWPGTFRRRAHVRKGRHNIAGARYDAYFSVAGKQFHGVTYGNNTQICHVKALK